MTFADWLRESKHKIDDYGLSGGVQSAALDLWGGFARRACHRLGLDQSGTGIYERDWDVLVVLDTCRTDVLAEVADEYDFLPERIPAFTSLGSTSWEWMADNFNETYREEIARTAYVTGNAHTRRLGDEFEADPEWFGLLDEVWEYAWDDEFDGIPPRPVTDRAIDAMRTRDPERLVVHYMQPHAPYRSLDMDWSVGDQQDADAGKVWDLLQIGELSHEEVWAAYRDNLRWVLDDVELLLENIDAETVVLTADHGEAFGEWGLYGHYRHVPISVLKEVPWVTTSATDSGTYEPETETADADLTGDDVQQRLQALGYR
ncbi:alkaline phosphatase family protein [Halorussus ruber]|uniref:hypothetical protein n=1 Tax=Halorussus ruber TaxID=1126238 RepID=UPI0010924351|nr:hypothetical protein [Halorussus ruber]